MFHPTSDLVVLVDEQGESTGTMEKLEAHHAGALHRAFSVFLFRSTGEIILQRRAAGKYHSGGLWSNACCSHPLPGETDANAARRRVREELGIDVKELESAGYLRYRAEVGNGLIENEWDVLFWGVWDGAFQPAPEEASAVEAFPTETVNSWISKEPEAFTAWFVKALQKVLESRTQAGFSAAG